MNNIISFEKKWVMGSIKLSVCLVLLIGVLSSAYANENAYSCRTKIVEAIVRMSDEHGKWRFIDVPENGPVDVKLNRDDMPYVIEASRQKAQEIYDSIVKKYFFPIDLDLPQESSIAIIAVSIDEESGMFISVIECPDFTSAQTFEADLKERSVAADIHDTIYRKGTCFTIMRTSADVDRGSLSEKLVEYIGESL